MSSLSKKEYLSLKMPTEEVPLSDHQRIVLALNTLGYDTITIPLPVLRQLYPLCRNAEFDITVTLVHREADWVVTHVEAGDQRQHHYGLAVDYGSTSILMQLVDLNSGSVIGEQKAYNGQITFGTDILTRITYSLEDPSHIRELQKATTETFHLLMNQLTESTGIAASQCPIMVVSGNTTMIHFLLGLNAWTVFASPYAPVTTDPGFLWGHELDLDFEGLLYFIPAASNYVGGDIVSGLLELELHRKEETSLFFDIGTNGELVIGNSQWLIAGAGAAGPALEGYISQFGMRAGPGAIDSVKMTNAASVQEMVSRFSPDETAEITVIRDGKEKKFEVVFKGTEQENGTQSSDGSVAFYGSFIKETEGGVEIVELGPGKLKDAGAVEGFIIRYVNDQPVKTPQDIIDIVKKSKRAIFIEGVTPSGRTGYFGFGV